ncbi:MAG: sensor histidine kinase, partial [Dehalococcoidales bacterium]|nr:sensor histidine kinase [Dehalococcoidales bacterium]
ELHDDVSSTLISLIQRLDTLLPIDRAKKSKVPTEKLEALRGQVVEALDRLRRCAQDLRPRILDDLGLVAALEWMAQDIEDNYGVDARVKVEGTERKLITEAQLVLFRIAQEALNNIKNHAGASMADVRLEFGEDKVVMTIKDNGKGFDVPGRIEDLAAVGKLGIMGMSERASLLGGNLEVKSEPGKGTQLTVRMPMPEINNLS